MDYYHILDKGQSCLYIINLVGVIYYNYTSIKSTKFLSFPYVWVHRGLSHMLVGCVYNIYVDNHTTIWSFSVCDNPLCMDVCGLVLT